MAYLAQDLGFYKDANIQLVDYETSAGMVQAYQNSSLDVISTVIDYALQLQTVNSNQRIFLCIDYSLGGDAIVSKKNIVSLADLKGKRIGYEASALGAYMITRALKIADLEQTEIITVPVDVHNHERAFQQNQVDALVTYEPTISILLNGGAKILFDSSQIPGEIFDIFITTQDTLTNKRKQLKIFVDGWFKALAYQRAHPLDAARRVASRQRLSPDDYLATFDKVEMLDQRANVDCLSQKLAEALKTHQKVMLREGFLQHPADITTIIDDTLIR